MAWNQPGSNGKDPWGQNKGSGSGPPDLDELVKNLQKKLAGIFGGGKKGGSGGGNTDGGNAGKLGIGLILIVGVGLWLISGFYIVQPGERGVVLFFGEKSEITDAGFHWRIPYPVETVEKVNVQKVHKIEIGYRTNSNSTSKTRVPREALMLTEDENIIDIEFAVQYKIKDAASYLFNVRNVESTITQVTESAIREIAGKSTMDFILTGGRDDVSQNTQALLQEILDKYEAGIFVNKVDMQEAQPPEEVKAAFDDAVKAREDEERFKNEAEAYANDIIPRARGRSARMIQEAEGYKASVVARSEGDAKRFSQISKEYAKAPRVTRDRMYLEAVEEVFSNTTKIFIDQKAGNNILYLPLDKLMSARRLNESNSDESLLLEPKDETGGAQPGLGRDTRNSSRSRKER